ncbi:MAG: hypothetical protein OSB33_06040 [Candidatus Poseidoniales archaeon]|nr:hypothetical protein [Candidatus Poseidoniales archaeon]
MRTGRRLALLLAISMLICIIPISNASSAPTHGGIHSVSSDETWNMGSELDAIVTVEAGATLTIATDYTLPVGASITVEQGGTLRVEDGSLTGGDFSQAVRMTPNAPTSLVAQSSVASGAFSLRIVASPGINMSGWSVSWDQIPAQDMNGGEHMINFSSPKSDFQLNFSLNPGSFTDLVIDHLEIDDGSTVTTTHAYLADPINCRIAGEYGTSFPLNIAGSAHFEDSTITGADVMITGAVTTTDADFMASGPLYVRGAGSSLMMNGGSIKMSSEDHDIDADGIANLDLENSGVEGTGGLIDLWERNIEQQEIHISIGSTCTGDYSCVHYALNGIGPNGATMQRSNVEGVALVPARTVEIGYADGTIWTENATIEIINFRTAWNLDAGMDSWSEGMLVPLPWDVSTFDILPHLDYPVISVDTVNLPDETGNVGRSISVEVTVSNSGTETAAIFIKCNIAGTENYASMTPTYSAMVLDAGETETLDGNWSYHTTGDAGLDCYVLEPTQFIDSTAFITKNVASSTRGDSDDVATVSWSNAVVDESDSMLFMLAALGLSIVIGLGVAIRFATADLGDDYREVNRESEDSDERVDRFADMMDEEE